MRNPRSQRPSTGSSTRQRVLLLIVAALVFGLGASAVRACLPPALSEALTARASGELLPQDGCHGDTEAMQKSCASHCDGDPRNHRVVTSFDLPPVAPAPAIAPPAQLIRIGTWISRAKGRRDGEPPLHLLYLRFLR